MFRRSQLGHVDVDKHPCAVLMIFVLQMVFDVAWQRNGSAVVKLALHPAGCGVSNHGFFKGRNCRANARPAIHPHPTLRIGWGIPRKLLNFKPIANTRFRHEV